MHTKTTETERRGIKKNRALCCVCVCVLHSVHDEEAKTFEDARVSLIFYLCFSSKYVSFLDQCLPHEHSPETNKMKIVIIETVFSFHEFLY